MHGVSHWCGRGRKHACFKDILTHRFMQAEKHSGKVLNKPLASREGHGEYTYHKRIYFPLHSPGPI